MNTRIEKIKDGLRNLSSYGKHQINHLKLKYEHAEATKQRLIQVRKLGHAALANQVIVEGSEENFAAVQTLANQVQELEKQKANTESQLKEDKALLVNLKQQQKDQHDSDEGQQSNEDPDELTNLKEKIHNHRKKLKELTERHRQIYGDYNDSLETYGTSVWENQPENEVLAQYYQSISEVEATMSELETRDQEVKSHLHKNHLSKPLIGAVIAALLLLVIFVALLLPGGGPVKAAQDFGDAIVSGDLKTYVRNLGITESEEELDNIAGAFALFTLGMGKGEGDLLKAKALRVIKDEKETASVLLVWQYTKKDVATIILMAKKEGKWFVVDINNNFKGDLKGNIFHAEKPLDNPIPGIVPENFYLKVKVNVPAAMGTATLVGTEKSIRFRGGHANFGLTKFGKYEVEIAVDGYKDQKVKVKASPESFPNVVDVDLGKPKPLDKEEIFIKRNGTNFELLIIDNKRGVSVSNLGRDYRDYLGISEDKGYLRFLGYRNIISRSLGGEVLKEWQAPGDSGIIMRPDCKEVAYIQNSDIFTLVPGKSEDQALRWSRNGLASGQVAWIDEDRILVAGKKNPMVVHRDGSFYVMPEAKQNQSWSYSGRASWFYSPEGYLRYVFANGSLFAPGKQKAVEKLKTGTRSLTFLGWSENETYQIAKADSNYRSNVSGILAIEKSGKATMMAPYHRHNGLYDIHHEGNYFAMTEPLNNTTGTYVGKVANNMKRIDDPASMLEWIDPERLVYTVANGSNLGTWLYSVKTGNSEKLFDYQADKVFQAKKGPLYLIANNTLWSWNNKGQPQAVGKEGSLNMSQLQNASFESIHQ